LQYGGLCAESLLSQFPNFPPFILLPYLRPPPKSWFYLLYDQRAVGPVHEIMIFAFASVVLSLIAFSLSIVLALHHGEKEEPGSDPSSS
jgi:hypothetical protein